MNFIEYGDVLHAKKALTHVIVSSSKPIERRTRRDSIIDFVIDFEVEN